MSREDAYEVVQGCAHAAWNKRSGNFRDLIGKDDRVKQYLSSPEIDSCFDPQHHLTAFG